MFRILVLTIFGALLAACSQGSKMDTENPLATLIPWDADGADVQTTPSGLQYVIVKEGPEDGISPGARDTVSALYEGRLNDGTFFDGNFERGTPLEFPLNRVIPGWTEGLQLMSEGDEFVFFVPSELGYGQNPRPGGPIKPGDDLIFRVALQKVIPAPVPRPVDAAAWEAYTPWNSENEGIIKTASGLEYVILKSGPEDGVSPIATDTVVAYYEGRFAETGDVFDSAFQRGRPEMFGASQVIPGWVEALSLMKRGDRWLVHIPSNLAYGPTGYGGIPPNTDLDFEIELVDIIPSQ